MTAWQIILFAVGLLAVGFCHQAWAVYRRAASRDLVAEFLAYFEKWCKSEAKDQALYNWMLDKSERVQAELGRCGLAHFRPAFENYIHHYYAVILNEIPGIRREFFDNFRQFNSIANQQLYERIQSVNACLRRFIGLADERAKRERAKLWNPLAMFCGGVGCVLGLPLYILRECRIISTDQQATIINGKIFSLLSGAVALVTLTGTVMSIVMGWEQFCGVITGWLSSGANGTGEQP